MEATARNWSRQAAELRQRAERLPEGSARDQLLAQAEQLDAAIDMLKILAPRLPNGI